MLEVKQEINNYFELKELLWGDNVRFKLKQVENCDMAEEFFSHIEELFSEDIVDITAVNDYIAYEFSFMDWLREGKTIDDIDSLEDLLEYAEGEAYEVIEKALKYANANDLWEYIQDDCAGDTLDIVFDNISSLEPNDYIQFDSIKSLSEFIDLAKDNEIVMEVINAIKKNYGYNL